VLPVNPTCAGRRLFGREVVPTLRELPLPADLVLVFRRPAALPEHEAELLGMKPPPAVVWFQLGIQHDGVAGRLEAAGIRAVQNRCMLVDHQRLL
jgi:predicted CoA-binding protein